MTGRRALLLPVLLLAACAWTRDRGADLADVFVLEASAGLGVAATRTGARRGCADGSASGCGVEPGMFHIYRVVRGSSWSGFVYVNLPEEGR